MLELQTLYYLLKKHNYDKYRKYLQPSDAVKKYYKDLDSLMSSLNRDIKLEEFVSSCKEFPSEDVLQNLFGEDYLQQSLAEIKKRQLAYDLAILSSEVSDGRKSTDDILKLVEKFDKLELKNNEYVTDDIDEILGDLDETTGIPFRLRVLQNATRGLRGGDFAVFFARTNVGKTTWLASEITYMSQHVDRPILWFNNEERGVKVKRRIIQSALGWNDEQLLVDREKTKQNYLTITKGNIKLKDDASLKYYEIERIIEEEKPSLVLFDQLDKIKGFKHSDRVDKELGSIYVWARELAKGFDIPVIGVTQAAVSAEGKAWLTTADIADSKTSKPAEVDLLVGIGKKNEEGYENLRFLSVLKNKLTGDEGRLECKIRTDIARYVDL